MAAARGRERVAGRKWDLCWPCLHRALRGTAAEAAPRPHGSAGRGGPAPGAERFAGAMSSLLKEDLEKKLFGPRRQRLHEFIEVEGAGAQRYYLCAAVTKNKEVEICMVKHWRVDREEKYEIVEKWFLKDLEMIDGKEADADNPHFEMHFHKVYNMEAYSCASKYTFARTLKRLNAMYLKKDFKIVNFDDTYLNDDSIWSSSNRDFLVLMRICFYASNLLCLSLCRLS